MMRPAEMRAVMRDAARENRIGVAQGIADALGVDLIDLMDTHEYRAFALASEAAYLAMILKDPDYDPERDAAAGEAHANARLALVAKAKAMVMA